MTLLDVNVTPGSSKRTDTQLLIILFTRQNIDCILIDKQVPVLQEKNSSITNRDKTIFSYDH